MSTQDSGAVISKLGSPLVRAAAGRCAVQHKNVGGAAGAGGAAGMWTVLLSAQFRGRREPCVFDPSSSPGMVQPGSTHMAVLPCALIAGCFAAPYLCPWLSFTLALLLPLRPRAGAERRRADSDSPASCRSGRA